MAGRQRQQHQRRASPSMARSAPFRLGTSTEARRPGQRLGEGQHLGGVGQLRQQPRRHEGADLDLALAGGVGVADPFELGGGGHDARRCSAGRRAGRPRGSTTRRGRPSGRDIECHGGSLEFPNPPWHLNLGTLAFPIGISQSSPARPRPHHPAPVRLRLRDGQHRARRRAGQHRRLGHQQAAGPAGRPGRHAAAGAQAPRRGAHAPPARRCWNMRARMLDSAARIERDMQSYAAGARGQVRILASVSAMTESLADDVAAFLQLPAHRNIQVDMEERVSPEIVRGVRDGLASLGVCWDAADLGALQSRPYRSDHLCIVVPPGHPLAGAQALRFERDAGLRAREPAGQQRGAGDAAARRPRSSGRTLQPPRDRHQLRGRAARGARRPGHQPGAARGGRAAGRGLRPAPHPAGRALGRAALHHLLSRRAARSRRPRSCWSSTSPRGPAP